MQTDIDPDVEADTPPTAADDPRRTHWQTAFVLLLAFTVLVAVVTFALSFYGLEDFGRTGMRLPGYLSWLVPLGVDLFSLCGIAATYLLRNADWQVRLYAWCVFLVPTGLSVAGNMAHADHRQLNTPGVVGAAVAPVLLALATHLVVVVRRHLAADIETDSLDQVVNELLPHVKAAAESHREVGQADSEEVAAMARALAVRRRNGSVAEQAAAAGVTERTVRRWFGQPARQARARPPARRLNGTKATTADVAAGHVRTEPEGAAK